MYLLFLSNNFPFQLYEAVYNSFQEGRNSAEGNFAVDLYTGMETSFKVYFPDLVESYIKSISIESEKGSVFNTIMDTRMSLHYFSVYDAPFDQVGQHFTLYSIFTTLSNKILMFPSSRQTMWAPHGNTAYHACHLRSCITATLSR